MTHILYESDEFVVAVWDDDLPAPLYEIYRTADSRMAVLHGHAADSFRLDIALWERVPESMEAVEARLEQYMQLNSFNFTAQ